MRTTFPSAYYITNECESVVPIQVRLTQDWGPTAKSITVAKLMKLLPALVLLLHHRSHLRVLPGANTTTQPDSFN